MLRLDTPKSWFPGTGASVATWQLAELIDRELPRVQAALNTDSIDPRTGEASGALAILAERMHMFYPKASVESLARRLNAIRRTEQRMTNLNLAEAVIFALGFTLCETDVAVLPGSMKDADEMVGVHDEIKGGPVYRQPTTKFIPRNGARSLANFARGFAYCDAAILSDVVLEAAAA